MVRRTTNVSIESRNDKQQNNDSDEPDLALAEGEVEKEATAIDSKVQERLGRQLKALYDDVVRQPIPDRLLSLMAQLEEKKGSDNV